MKKLLALFLLLIGLFSGCSRVSDEDIIKAREALKNGAIIVDVRTPEEFSKKHILGAINLPITEIMKKNVKISKDKELILYCETGSRSRVSARYLTQEGWSVYDVATQADWQREIK